MKKSSREKSAGSAGGSGAGSNSKLLPLPDAVLRHHGVQLFPILDQWKSSNRVPPVLLITGIPGVGKRHVAYFLAQWMNCERIGFAKTGAGADPAADEFSSGLFGNAIGTPIDNPIDQSSLSHLPCGACSLCQKALHSTWVDFTEIAPESSEEGEAGKLRIEQFRAIQTQLGHGAHESAYRVVLIRDADRMTPQAANSLLKLLEEPPPTWVFLLTASDPSLLLPTLVSRCQRLRLRPFQDSELLPLLEADGIAPDQRSLCLTLAQGSWKRAVAYGREDFWARKSVVHAFLQKPEQELATLIDWGGQSGENFERLLVLLELALRDPITGEAKTPIAGNRNFWIERVERIAEIRKTLHVPLNRKLLVQELLTPWLGTAAVSATSSR